MATMVTATFYDGPATPTDDDNDRLIVDYSDNTQRIFNADSDVSDESERVIAIYNACFT